MDQFRVQPTPQQRATALGDRLRTVKGMVGGNPSAFIDYLSQRDPSFAAFAQSVRGKTPEQAFSERGLDFNQFSGLL